MGPVSFNSPLTEVIQQYPEEEKTYKKEIITFTIVANKTKNYPSWYNSIELDSYVVNRRNLMEIALKSLLIGNADQCPLSQLSWGKETFTKFTKTSDRLNILPQDYKMWFGKIDDNKDFLTLYSGNQNPVIKTIKLSKDSFKVYTRTYMRYPDLKIQEEKFNTITPEKETVADHVGDLMQRLPKNSSEKIKLLAASFYLCENEITSRI